MGRAGTSFAVPLWCHAVSAVATAPKLAAGYPDAGVLPIAKDQGVLVDTHQVTEHLCKWLLLTTSSWCCAGVRLP